MFGFDLSVIIGAALIWVLVILSILMPVFVYRISVNSRKILTETQKLRGDLNDLLTLVKADTPAMTQQTEE